MSLFGLQLFSAAVVEGANAVEAWVQRYNSVDGGSQDEASIVAADADGNAIVVGYTDDRITGPDMLIIKYSEAGLALWTNRYNGPVNDYDFPSAAAVGGNGTVFVTGGSRGGASSYDYATMAYSASGVALWTNRYNGPNNHDDRPSAMAVDDAGNVVVTGYSYGGGSSDYDYVTIAYSGAGAALWTNRYNGAGSSDDRALAVAVDNTGNVFVTGHSTGVGGGSDYVTIAYSGSGISLWTNRYNGPGSSIDYPSAVAVNKTGKVFVTGRSAGTNGTVDDFDYATVAYSGAGVALWTNRYNGPGNSFDYANALVSDNDGNVFVTGSSRGSGVNLNDDYATIAYSSSGVALWTNRFNGPANDDDNAYALSVGGSGMVFVTGRSYDSGGYADYATIAYSTAGAALWTNRYNGPRNIGDYAYAVTVNGSGTVFVTGGSTGGDGDLDYTTIAYSGAGVALWTNRYNGPGNSADGTYAVAVDKSGTVFVTGSSAGTGGNSDYATIAYSGAGVALWTNRYNGLGNYADYATALAVDNNGDVIVTGFSTAGFTYDYTTIKYSGAGVALWTNRYNGPVNANDYAFAVAVDNSGRAFVTGYSAPIEGYPDYVTTAYSGMGAALWTNRYDGPGNRDDQASAVAVDRAGNVFVTGSSRSNGNNRDYATIAYSGVGAALWTNRYNGPGNFDDSANAIAVDGSGNVFVTGTSPGAAGWSDYATIAYSGSGTALWTNRYNGPANRHDFASAVTVDNRGNVFVTGHSSGTGANYDYATIAYSGSGMALWTNRFNGPGNGDDVASGIAVDNDRNVFVTGASRGTGGNDDYATIAYSGTGVPLWTNRYSGPANGHDLPATKSCLAIGPDGAVYVTGSSDGNYPASDTSYDYATVKYVWRTQLAIQPLTPGSKTVHLNLSGPASSTWSLERAVTLGGPWTTLGPSLLGTNGLGTFQDANPPAQGAFYRATQP